LHARQLSAWERAGLITSSEDYSFEALSQLRKLRDLQATTRQLLANWMRRRLGRPARHDPNSWHPRDHAVARWYSVLMVVGYGAATAVLLAGVLPVLARLFGTALARITGDGAPGGTGLLDSIAFLVLAIGELAVAGLMFVRERRQAHLRARLAADQSTP